MQAWTEFCQHRKVSGDVVPLRARGGYLMLNNLELFIIGPGALGLVIAAALGLAIFYEPGFYYALTAFAVIAISYFLICQFGRFFLSWLRSSRRHSPQSDKKGDITRMSPPPTTAAEKRRGVGSYINAKDHPMPRLQAMTNRTRTLDPPLSRSSPPASAA
jgi:hypothetical protein